MPISAVCPHCGYTITIERVPGVTCPVCGKQFGFVELQRNGLIIDRATEKQEISVARDFFVNGEFLSASNHFKTALDCNRNSYAAVYFIKLCDIYMHEMRDSEAGGYNVMDAVIDMVRTSAQAIARSGDSVTDKLAFMSAMLTETKIIISRRLTDRDELFQNDIEKYREVSVSELTKLLELFKLDSELIMSFAPEVKKALAELCDCALNICYKAVQTVARGETLYAPSDAIYSKLASLCNELCFLGHSFDENFDTRKYAPDFSQNLMLNEKVLARLDEFAETHKPPKKFVITDPDEYNSILSECDKALKYTYLSCYKSLCSRNADMHAKLFFDGFKLVYRLLFPRAVLTDKKVIELVAFNATETSERCDILTRFLVDAYELGDVETPLKEFYKNLYEIVSEHYVPAMTKIAKSNDQALRATYRKVCYDCAVSCMPALAHFVDFAVDSDKYRSKLVKICNEAVESFLLKSGMSLDEIEQSNFFRPILQISTALMEENNE